MDWVKDLPEAGIREVWFVGLLVLVISLLDLILPRTLLVTAWFWIKDLMQHQEVHSNLHFFRQPKILWGRTLRGSLSSLTSASSGCTSNTSLSTSMLLSLSCTCHLPAGVEERIENPKLSSSEEETGSDYLERSMERTQDLNLTIFLPWLHEQNICDILFDKNPWYSSLRTT